jgi:hypothetical protein
MKDRAELAESLGRAFEHISALHAILAAMMIDVAALRQVVLKSVKSNNCYRHAIMSESAKTKCLIMKAMQAYDQEIAILKCRGLWKN